MKPLYDILKPYTIELLRLAWLDGSSSVGVVLDAFNVANESVELILDELAQRVKGIDETTAETIQMIIGRQASEGWTLAQVRDELLARAITESKTRADLIAVTETADAYSRGSMLAYRASGQVAGTEWLLAAEPCPICERLAARGVVPLGEDYGDGIMHPPAHPSCRCAIAPVLT